MGFISGQTRGPVLSLQILDIFSTWSKKKKCERLAEDTAKTEPFLGNLCGWHGAAVFVTGCVSAGQTRAAWFGLFGFDTI